jgi:type II secretory pathway pseudopilin PulG
MSDPLSEAANSKTSLTRRYAGKLIPGNRFTIMELLVTFVIIGILAVALFGSLGNSIMKSRDARRLADMREIEKALNLYSAQFGSFPKSPDGAEITVDGKDALSQTLAEGRFIRSVPRDPKSPDFSYHYQSDGKTFTLSFCIEGKPPQGFEHGCENTIRP